MYSSPSGRAICSAALMALTNSRETLGSATLGAAGRRQRLDRPVGLPAQVGAVSAPTARSSAGRGRAAGVEQGQQQVPRLDGGVAVLGWRGRRRR